jgi:heptosyltransferase-2
MAKVEWLIDKSIGSFLSFVLGGSSKVWPFRKKDIVSPKDIAIIKLWALGESILTLPVIKSIKQRYPEAKITVLARNHNKKVYENLPYVDNIILFEPSNILKLLSLLGKFDLSFDCEPYLKISGLFSWFCAKQRIGFSHTIRSWLYTHPIDFNDQQHEVLTYMDMAKIVGIDYVPQNLEKVSYDKNNREKVDSLLHQAGIFKSDFLIGFCVGAEESSKQRMWPAENFAKLADMLVEEKGAKIVFTGSSREIPLIESVRSMMKNDSLSVAGKTNVKDLFYLAECCDLFISNDTGPMHVAAAQGTKTIGLFGPNLPVRFGPFGKNNVSLAKNLPCRPCINVHKGQLPECKYKKKDMEGYCMQLISVEDVFKEAVRLI